MESIVDKLAELARSETTPAEFYEELVKHAADLLAALGVAVWLRAGRGTLQRQFELSTGDEVWAQAEQPWHARLLVRALDSRHPWSLPPDGSVPDTRPPLLNSSQYVLVFGPLFGEHEAAGVLEVVLRPGCDAEALQGYERFVGLLAELAADYERQRRLRELMSRQALWGRLEQFIRRVHARADVDQAAFEIANEGRLLLDCDRLSVATWDGETCQLRAVSGLDGFDRRANSVRAMELLIDGILSLDAPSWWTPETDEPAPHVASALHAHLEQSHARQLAVVPLKAAAADERTDGAYAPVTLVGALVIEQFEGAPLDGACRLRAEVVAEHSAVALGNLLMQERLPFARLSRWLARRAGPRRRRMRTNFVVGLLLLAAVVVALSVIPADFDIEARGTLEPAEQREVFATADAIVDHILVAHGALVTAGQTLIELRRPQLDFEFSRVAGELQTTRKRLATVQASRLVTNPINATALEHYNQMTGEEEELKELLRGFEQQDRLLHEQQAELTLRSPMTGQILTWDVEQLLSARPVQRGQVLLTVARTEGPWILKVDVPDIQAGYVLRAQRELQETLSVSFILAAHPQQVHIGKVQVLAMATDLDEDDRPVATVTVEVDRSRISPLRPRTTVIAKIHCGRKPIGYVWFHGLWRAIQSHWLF